ncbi:hypothetical protein [Weissella confusa]|uniref:hypothetical protein n=1 Tax=Weissella confusa TaxID=1583 RepID=UPI001FB546FC|nr:hypothetical protein [Weissella confusa]
MTGLTGDAMTAEAYTQIKGYTVKGADTQTGTFGTDKDLTFVYTKKTMTVLITHTRVIRTATVSKFLVKHTTLKSLGRIIKRTCQSVICLTFLTTRVTMKVLTVVMSQRTVRTFTLT